MSHFIPEPSNFAETSRLPTQVKKAWLKVTLKDIKNQTKNQTFLMEDPRNGEPVNPCMCGTLALNVWSYTDYVNIHVEGG